MLELRGRWDWFKEKRSSYGYILQITKRKPNNR